MGIIYSPGEKHATLTNTQARTAGLLGVKLFRALEEIRAIMLDTGIKAHQRAGKMDEVASNAVRLVSETSDQPGAAEMARRKRLTDEAKALVREA